MTASLAVGRGYRGCIGPAAPRSKVDRTELRRCMSGENYVQYGFLYISHVDMGNITATTPSTVIIGLSTLFQSSV